MVDKVAIAGGTRVLAKLVTAADPAPVLAEVETLGDITEQSAEVQATPLSSKTVRYIRGLTDGQPLEITMFLLTDDASQKAIKSARDTGAELELTVQPDDTAEQYRFRYLPLTHTIRTGNPGDPKRRVVGGRVNSAVIDEANKNPVYVAASGG